MPRLQTADKPRKRAIRVLEFLLSVASKDTNNPQEKKVSASWISKTELKVTTTLNELEAAINDSNNTQIDNHQITKKNIRNSFYFFFEAGLAEDERSKIKTATGTRKFFLTTNSNCWELKLKFPPKCETCEDKSKYAKKELENCHNRHKKGSSRDTDNKIQPTNNPTDPNKIWQAAELLRSFDFTEEEGRIKTQLEQHSRGFVLIQAHTAMQQWFIWRLTKCMGDFERIKKIRIQLTSIYQDNFDYICEEIGRHIGLERNVNKEILTKYLIEFSATQPIIIVIDELEKIYHKNKISSHYLDHFFDFWSDIFKHFKDIDTNNDRYFILFLVEKKRRTKGKNKGEAIILNLTEILKAENKFNLWETEHRKELENQFNWDKKFKNEIANKIVSDDEPYSVVRKICSNVFNCNIDGEIQRYWDEA